MNVPPSFLRVRLRRGPSLWLPLFLLWLLLFLLLWPLFALAALALFLIKPGERAAIGAFFAQLWRMLCALRGTEIDVELANHQFHLGLY
jgi:hypothetical protein